MKKKRLLLWLLAGVIGFLIVLVLGTIFYPPLGRTMRYLLGIRQSPIMNGPSLAEKNPALVAPESVSVIVNGKKCANASGKEIFSTVFLCRKMDGGARLFWVVRGWPDYMRGVLVKKRVGKSAWTPLVSDRAVIVPALTPEREWSAQGLTAAQAVELQKKTADFLRKRNLTAQTGTEFAKQLKQFGVRPGDRIAMTEMPDFALMTGFAAFDAAPVDGTEYGLFAVLDDGRKAKAPFAVSTLSAPVLKKSDLVDILPSFAGRKIQLKWSVGKNSYDRLGLIGFDVLRSANGQRKKLNRAYGIANGDVVGFSISEDGSADGIVKYSLIPIDYFKGTLPPVELSFDSSVYGSAAPATIQKIVPEDADLVVHASIAAADLKKVAKINLERREEMAFSFQNVATAKPESATLSLRDSTAKKKGEFYFYRVILTLNNGETVASKELGADSPAQNPKLAAPQNFTVKIEKNGAGYQLRFSWSPVTGAKSYLFYSKDSDLANAPLAQSGIKTEPSFVIPYPASHQTMRYCYGISALPQPGNGQDESAITEIRDFPLPAATPPRVRNVQFRASADLIVLDWKLPDDPSILELEVFINGKSFGKLAKNATHAEFAGIRETAAGKDKSGNLRFGIVTRNELGEAVEENTFFYSMPHPDAGKLPVVQGFSAKQDSATPGRVVLQWMPIPLEKGRMDGFALEAENTTHYHNVTISSDDNPANPQLWAYPAEWKKGDVILFKINAQRIIQLDGRREIVSGRQSTATITLK